MRRRAVRSGGVPTRRTKVTYIILELCGDDMCHHICVEHTLHTGEQSFAEILSCIVSDQVAHLEMQSFLDKLTAALTVSKLQ